LLRSAKISKGRVELELGLPDFPLKVAALE
jgi:hypothetical protein